MAKPHLPSPLLLALALLLGFARVARAEEAEGCIACHGDEDTKERYRIPALRFAEDAHARAGLSCTACHGGVDGTLDYVEAHDKDAGFRGRIPAAEVVDLCARCHDDEATMRELGGSPLRGDRPGHAFRTSVHAKIHPVEGFERPTCISCHGAHGVLPASEPASAVHPTHVPATCDRCHGDLDYMRAFTSARVRVDQWVEYRTSTHGKLLLQGDTRVAVCSSCHGNHAILRATDPASSVHPLNVAQTCGKCHADAEYMHGYETKGRDGGRRPLPTDQLADYRESVHHARLVEGDLSSPTCNDCHGNHGATPPEVRAVANMCGQCHSRPAELLEGSDLAAELGARGLPGCATCHGNHRVVRPTDGLLAAIAQGLTPSGWRPDAPWRRRAEDILGDIVRLEDRLGKVTTLVDEVENYGMDVTRARLRLHEAGDALVQARVVVHTFDPARIRAILEGGEEERGAMRLLDDAEEIAQERLKERGVRRLGLVVALEVIALLVVALILKMRRMEARTAPDA